MRLLPLLAVPAVLVVAAVLMYGCADEKEMRERQARLEYLKAFAGPRSAVRIVRVGGVIRQGGADYRTVAVAGNGPDTLHWHVPASDAEAILAGETWQVEFTPEPRLGWPMPRFLRPVPAE